MAINISGILKSPQGSAIQNAEIIFEQTRTSTEVLAGTKFSVITNQTGNYSSSLGVGTYVFKVRFQEETQYRTVASNVIVTQSMNNYTLNQIIQDQSQLQDVDYDLLQAVIQARDQAAASAQAAQASQTTSTTKASEASSSAQAALASKNAAQTSEANALASKNTAQTSQTNATNSQSQAQASQTSAAGSQSTATTKASEASSSAQQALASKNAAQTSEANALSSKNQAQASQTSASNSQISASQSQSTATTKAADAAASQASASSKADEAATSQTNSEASQATATTKAGQASSSQTAAASSQSTATTKATESANSATLAQKWAANPENSIVSGGLYSALHYAAKAAQAAQTASGQLVWRGGWSAQAGTAPPTPTSSTQDFYRITQAGTILSVQYEVGDYIHWDTINSIWFKMDGTDSVISVNGRTGAVVITRTDVGLSAVNNWGASSQTNDASTTTYATTAGVKAAYDLAATKLSATATAVSATKLDTARSINGTSFDGTANITTNTWGTSRNISIGLSGKAVNGSQDVSWTLAEIGALPLTGGILTGNVSSSATYRTSVNQSLGFVMQRPGTTSQVGVGQGMDGNAVLGYGTETALQAYIKIGLDTAIVDTGQGVKNLYHEGFKPTAADVGALSLTGGTVTGNVAVDGNFHTTGSLLVNSRNVIGVDSSIARFGDSAYARVAKIYAKDGDFAVAPSATASYRVYHQGFKPTAADVGALPLTGGTVASIIDNTTNIGKTVVSYEVIASWAHAVGSSKFIQPSTAGNPTGRGGYWQIIGRRDSSGGYAGIWVDYQNGSPDVYLGKNEVGTNAPIWAKVYTDRAKPTADDVGALPSTLMRGTGDSSVYYIKLADLPANAGGSPSGITGIISGGSNFGTSVVPCFYFSASTRGSSNGVPTMRMINFVDGSAASGMELFSVLNGARTEIWLKTTAYPYEVKVSYLSGAQFNLFPANHTAIEPSGIMSRLVPTTVYHTGFKPTPEEIGAQPATSDRRLKTNIKEYSTNVLDLVKDIKVYTFSMLDKSGITKLGTMAQDWEQQLPETLLEVPVGEETYKGLDSLSLAQVLLKQIQELAQKVEQLESKQ